jgi:hypothetical protein
MQFEDTNDVMRTSTLSYLEAACTEVEKCLDKPTYGAFERFFFADEKYTGLLVSMARITNRLTIIDDVQVDLDATFMGLFVGSAVVEMAKIDMDVYTFALSDYAFNKMNNLEFNSRYELFALGDNIIPIDDALPVPVDQDYDTNDFIHSLRFAISVGLEVDTDFEYAFKRQLMVDYVMEKVKKLST